MTSSRLHFGAFLYTPGTHSAGWRHPDANPRTDMHFPYYAEMARTAERGKLDTIFLQDTAAIGGSGRLDLHSPYRPSQGPLAPPRPGRGFADHPASTTNLRPCSTAPHTFQCPSNNTPP